MVIKWEFTFDIDIPSPKLKDILRCFAKVLCPLLENWATVVIRSFAQAWLEEGRLARMLGSQKVCWKTFSGYERTKIATPYGEVFLPQLQVRDVQKGRRRYVTRLLLGVERWKRIPMITNRYLGLMGALAPLRVVNKFLSLMSGAEVSLMAIVRAMRETAKTIPLGIDVQETVVFEADGTGIPVLSSGKRGKELAILAQRKRRGGIRIAGMSIGSYKKGWGTLFRPLTEGLRRLGRIMLITDGDTSPLKGLKGVTVILQRCLFHIAHEIKYTLWKDRVKRKKRRWRYVLGKTLDITHVRRLREEPGIIKQAIRWKRSQLTRLIHYCEKRKLRHTVAYLKEAKPDIFSGIERRIGGGTSSLLERVMRTVNQRINIAQWSSESALAVAKIRGAYYYNNFDVT
jgi:hypothetical protein